MCLLSRLLFHFIISVNIAFKLITEFYISTINPILSLLKLIADNKRYFSFDTNIEKALISYIKHIFYFSFII